MVSSNPAVGDSADAYLAQVSAHADIHHGHNTLSSLSSLHCQGEMELKRGCDSKRTLLYLNKAVDLNDYDETALIVRSK